MSEVRNEEPDLQQYMERVNSGAQWVIGHHLGTMFIKTNDRIRKVHNVLKRRSLLIANTRAFLERIQGELEETGHFVHVTVGKMSKVKFYYCHRLIFTMSTGTQILLMGRVAFNKGLFTECRESITIDDHSHVLLQNRIFRIRINASEHVIFIHNEDLLYNNLFLYDYIRDELLLDEDRDDCDELAQRAIRSRTNQTEHGEEIRSANSRDEEESDNTDS